MYTSLKFPEAHQCQQDKYYLSALSLPFSAYLLPKLNILSTKNF